MKAGAKEDINYTHKFDLNDSIEMMNGVQIGCHDSLHAGKFLKRFQSLVLKAQRGECSQMFAHDEIEYFKDAVKNTLETRGVLARVRVSRDSGVVCVFFSRSTHTVLACTLHTGGASTRGVDCNRQPRARSGGSQG